MSDTPRTDSHERGEAGLLCHARQLERDLTAANERLADIDETHKAIVEGKCAGDELHCTCVPALRDEIARLTGLLADEELLNGEAMIEAMKLKEHLAASQAARKELLGVVDEGYQMSMYAAATKSENTDEFLKGDDDGPGLFDRISVFQGRARAVIAKEEGQ